MKIIVLFDIFFCVFCAYLYAHLWLVCVFEDVHLCVTSVLVHSGELHLPAGVEVLLGLPDPTGTVAAPGEVYPGVPETGDYFNISFDHL